MNVNQRKLPTAQVDQEALPRIVQDSPQFSQLSSFTSKSIPQKSNLRGSVKRELCDQLNLVNTIPYSRPYRWGV